MADTTPNGINITTPTGTETTNSLYAISNGTFSSVSDDDITTSCLEIKTYLKTMKLYNSHDSVTPITPSADPYSVHWVILRDYIMPDANAYIDNMLKSTYYVPLNKTENGSTCYSRQIVRIAALYCAWRIETRDYIGGGMPNESPYAQSLKAALDNELNNLISGKIRLKGQRLKSANSRFCNPHIEPFGKSEVAAPAPPINPQINSSTM